ncbi:MAG: hypothetical protein CEO22_466 [Candidatus Berkelbacteria bacterium Gr01-1014_85]|uniref:Uncharacterized protein n=1 Tax=Candidatus Berkelbacteria bacterium Gr01-1014_85 TaxID=2017150 RepID=A0A554JAX3_9BACT|nr:MAG: hypothetical protein CEO22_466 [Candidatus Berkelbacteria bacterium Gr01-1014_85]
MTHKLWLLTTIATALLSLTGLLTVIYNSSPSQPGALTWFYLCSFLVAVSLLTLVGYLIRLYRSNFELVYISFRISVRQALIAGAGLCLILYLQALRVLSIPDLIAIVIAAGLFELFFHSRKFKQYPLGSEQ